MTPFHSAIGRLVTLSIGVATLAFGLWGLPRPPEQLEPVNLPAGLNPDEYLEFCERFAESEGFRVEHLTLDLYRRVWVQAVGCWLCFGAAMWQLFGRDRRRPSPRDEQLPHPPPLGTIFHA
jgi:hypothetical protein